MLERLPVHPIDAWMTSPSDESAAGDTAGDTLRTSWTGRLTAVDEALTLRLLRRLLGDSATVHDMKNDPRLSPLEGLLNNPSQVPHDTNSAFVVHCLLSASGDSNVVPFIDSASARVGDVVRLAGRLTALRADSQGLVLSTTSKLDGVSYSTRFRESALNGGPLRDLVSEDVLILGILESRRQPQLVGIALMLGWLENTSKIPR